MNDGSDADVAPTVTGVVGQSWRADVTPWGDVTPWTDARPLRWHVAAEDRWHDPAVEPTVRQVRLEGTPVTETRVRVPSGDVVQRVWTIPDRGGLTIVEVENESPRAVAVAFSGRPVLTDRPPSDVPVQGIDLPDGALVLPVGHRTSVRVGVVHEAARWGATPLASIASDHRAVVDGWRSTADRASRLDLPDDRLVEGVVAGRCDLLLAGPVDADDPVGTVLDIAELVRLGEPSEPWLSELVPLLERLARQPGSDADVALDAAHAVFVAAGDRRGRRDLGRIVNRRRRAPFDASPFAEVRRGPSAGRFVRQVERRLVAGGDLLPIGIPGAWQGTNFEVHGVPSRAGGRVSFAVRWHGERPAVLWEQSGDTIRLTASKVDPAWSTELASGEALWTAPPARRSLSATAEA